MSKRPYPMPIPVGSQAELFRTGDLLWGVVVRGRNIQKLWLEAGDFAAVKIIPPVYFRCAGVPANEQRIHVYQFPNALPGVPGMPLSVIYADPVRLHWNASATVTSIYCAPVLLTDIGARRYVADPAHMLDSALPPPFKRLIEARR